MRAVITGKNAAATGYTIGLDYLRLKPASIEQVYEAESLTASVTGSGTLSAVNFSNATNGQYLKGIFAGAGGAMNLPFHVTAADSYLVWVRYAANNDGGRVQFKLDGVNEFSVVDTYGATNGVMNEIPLGVTFFATGTHTLTAEIVGKNAASSGFNVAIDAIRIVRLEDFFLFEAEALSSSVTLGRSVATIAHSGASNGAFHQAALMGVGEHVTYTIPSLPEGTYNVNVGIKTDPAYGRVKVQFNGAGLDVTRDGYSTSGYFIGFDSERGNYNSQPVTTPGAQSVRFEITEKNAASTGFGVGVDYFFFARIKRD